MNMNPKVSLVVPCYNGSKFIDNFMKSLLELNYDNIQLIITDDGSKDDSYEKLLNYEPQLVNNGIEYIVLHKENGGQPSAFNYGIEKATGKYVAWPDIDDRMHPDFLNKKVEYMEMNPNVDFLLSKSAIVPLNEPNKVLGYTWPKRITDNSSLVDRTLRDYDSWFEPGAYFAKMESLDKFIPNRHIYDACGTWSGPQIQIVLPFFYKGKIGYLDECLYDYYIHENQHHSQVRDKERLKRKNIEIKNVLVATIKSINAKDENQMLSIVDERMIRSETLHAFRLKDKDWFIESYSKFDDYMISSKDKLRYYIIRNKLLSGLYELYKLVKRNPLG